MSIHNTGLGQSAILAVAESMEKATLAINSALHLCLLNFICLRCVANATLLHHLKMLKK